MTTSFLDAAHGTVDVLPIQIWQRAAVVPPELRLQIAILRQAIADLARHCKRDRTYRDALLWVVSDDDEWPFSFLNVCAQLGVDPAAVREHVLADYEPNRSPPLRTPAVEDEQRRGKW